MGLRWDAVDFENNTIVIHIYRCSANCRFVDLNENKNK